jgi:type II secretory pathway pseudopilin PulG
MKPNPCKPPTASATFMREACYSGARSTGGFTLVEIAVSVALLGLVFATALGSLMVLNRHATSTRLMTNVREILQRNIETAMAVPFTSASVPAILAITPANGSAWDEGIAGNDPVNIYTSRDGTTKITGTLLRIVIAEPNSVSADIRRVTFRLNYAVFGRNLSYDLTTIRANDQ